MNEKEKLQFHLRAYSIALVLLVFMVCISSVLYDLQIVNGASYLAYSQRNVIQTESIEASRGDILDRYGRVLVTNRTSYNVSLETSLMGTEKNTILLTLLDICREQEVTWTDTLPISTQAPFVFAQGSASQWDLNRLSSFAEKVGASSLIPGDGAWNSYLSATDFMEALRVHYGLPDNLTSRELRDVIGVLYELSLRSYELTTVSYVFAQDVDIDFIATVRELKLAGVSIDTSSVRSYETEYAAHLLGRTALMSESEQAYYKELGYDGDEVVGKDGVEKAFESWLHGTEGLKTIETDTQGTILNETYTLDPEPGNNVNLTIDIRLQEATERALSQRIPELPSEGAMGGAAVVIDVDNGEVLAMASYPTYDLSTVYSNQSVYQEVVSDPLNPFYNRALQGLYAPGSTFKMVVAVGGLEEDLIEPDTQILDTGVYRYSNWDYQPMCWIYRQYGGTHGLETVSEAIRDSCNIFFYDTGRRLGIEQMVFYANMFGLGESTGIELEEKVGRVAGPETSAVLGQTWYEGQTLSAAIGQDNNQFTPLQLANYIATLVNGGTRYSVHLLQAVKSYDYQEILYQSEPQVVDQIEIEQENLEAILEGMGMVADVGGSVYSYMMDLPVKVGVKTGSAQVAGQEDSNAVLVCFAPYDDPEIAIAIAVEGGGGGSEIGIIAADILEYYFSDSMGLEQTHEENTLLR